MSDSYTDAAAKRLCTCINMDETTIMEAIKLKLMDFVARGFDGENAVAGLWLASEFLKHSNPMPMFYVGYGPDLSKQFDGPECLSQNVLNKARACALAGMDTLEMEKNPHHFLVMCGKYFPWGGAILRRIGRIEFVFSISGFSQYEDHAGSEECWNEVTRLLFVEVAEDLRRADLEKEDPEYCKYPVGLIGRSAGLGNLHEFPGQIG